MPTQINVSIESFARFRSGSTTSEQKEFGQYQEYRTLLAQILKVMVILASLVGAGVAIGWFCQIIGELLPQHSQQQGNISNKSIDTRKLSPQAPFRHCPVLPPQLSEQNTRSLTRKAEAEGTTKEEQSKGKSELVSNSEVTVAMIQLSDLSTAQSTLRRLVLNPTTTLAFAIDENSGLIRIDISNPLRPMLIGTPISTGGKGLAIALNSEGTLAFVTDQHSGLTIFNITNPYALNTIGTPLSIGENNLNSIAVNSAATIAFIADRTTGLHIIDTTNPQRMAPIGTPLSTGGNTFALALNPSCTFAFVLDQNTGLNIIFVPSLSTPILVASQSIGQNKLSAITLNADSTFAFILDGSGVYIVNITLPISPTVLSSLSVGQNNLTGVALNPSATFAFIADRQTGLYTIDVTNPLNPKIRNNLDQQNLSAFTLNSAATLAFVLGQSGELRIIKLQETALPNNHIHFLSSTLPGGYIGGVGLNSKASLLYFTWGGPNGAATFFVYNVTNLYNATQVGMIYPGDSNDAIALNPAATMAFVTNYMHALYVIDIANPATPILISNKPELNAPTDIVLNSAANLAYVTGQHLGLYIINITDPYNPNLIGNPFYTGGYATSISLNPSATLAFVSDWLTGLHIINITNPYNTTLVGNPLSIKSQNYAIALNPSATLIYLVDQNLGLQIFNISDPLTPTPIGNPLSMGGNTQAITLDSMATFAFVLDANTGFSIIDISNPYISITKLQTGRLNSLSGANAITLNPEDTVAFIASQGSGLSIYDVGCNYFSIPIVFSGDVMKETAIFRVAIPSNGQIFFFKKEGGEPLRPPLNIIDVFQINENSQRVPLPGWLSFSRTNYSLTGKPSKDFNNQRIIIETQINNTDNTVTDYTWSYIYVEPSLIIDTTGRRISVQSPHAFGSLSMQLSNPAAGRLVTQTFSGISFTFDPLSGTGNGIGTIQGINALFQDLQFSIDDPKLYSNTSFAITIDDSLNVPQSVSASLIKFMIHQPPVLNPNILLNQTFKANQALSFIIPESTFSANPNSLDLSYSVSRLPTWLNFNPTTRQFVGTPPLGISGQSFDVDISVNDGYKSAATNWGFTIRDIVAPVFNSNSTFSQSQTIQALQAYFYPIPENTFIDRGGLPISYSASLTSGLPLPNWLNFDSASEMFSGIPPIESLGDVINITLTANNGYRTNKIDWQLRIQNHTAPLFNPKSGLIQNQTFRALERFLYAIPTDAFLSDIPITYSATLSNGNSLPSWFSFIPGLNVFTGTSPVTEMGDNLDIILTARNTYFSTNASMNFRIQNYGPPVFNPESLFVNQTIQANQVFSYTIPANSFIDPLPITYSVILANGNPLPLWLNFNPTINTFSGIPPISSLGQIWHIRITASNEYKSTNLTWQLSIQNHFPPEFNPLSMFGNQTVFASHSFDYVIPDNAFIDQDDLPLSYSISGSALQSWLIYNPKFNSLKGTAPSTIGTDLLIVSANNGYFSNNVSWVITIAPNEAPRVGIPLQNATAIINQEFVYPISSHAFISNDTLSYTASSVVGNAVRSLPTWLRLDQVQGVITGKPSEIDLGDYRILIHANTPYGLQANQRFSIDVSRSAFDEFLYLLKFIGPAVSALGAGYKLYQNRAFIRNLWKGEGYVKRHISLDQTSTTTRIYTLSIPAKQVKNVVVMERVMPEGSLSQCGVSLMKCVSYHIYGAMTLTERQHASWIHYDDQTNEISVNPERVPSNIQDFVIQVRDKRGVVLEELMALDFLEPQTEEQELTINPNLIFSPVSESSETGDLEENLVRTEQGA